MTTEEEDLYWLTATVLQEAGGEPAEGRLGVAWSIVNRCNNRGQHVLEVVLAPWQYSCWNTTSPTKKLLVSRKPDTWEHCDHVARQAYYDTTPDPTHGSTHYLRPDVLPKLPSWYKKELVRAVLGHHHFLKVD